MTLKYEVTVLRVHSRKVIVLLMGFNPDLLPLSPLLIQSKTNTSLPSPVLFYFPTVHNEFRTQK